MRNDKKFLVIGDLNWITYKEIFPLIKNNRIWLGFNYVKEFKQPDGTIKKFGNKLWFTNLDHSKRHEKLPLWKNYNPEEYPIYDNYSAWNVDRVTDIPVDKVFELTVDEETYKRLKDTYKDDLVLIDTDNGYHIKVNNPIIGVPITFLDKFNPEQFEIVVFRKGEDGKDLIFTNEGEREFNRTFVSVYDSYSGDDQKCRRENLWKSYLCKNNNQTDLTPVDMFFPISMRGCAEPYINLYYIKTMGYAQYTSRQLIYNGNIVQKTYHRLFVRIKTL